MAKKRVLNPIAATVGAAVVASTMSAAPAFASDNPFTTQDLAGGFMLAEKGEGKCGEGKCGEGKCGEEGMTTKDGKSVEGKCGEGKASQEGKCGEKKTESEGKCGEGKCGG